MKNFDIKNKTVLVTGSNRGIGEAYVLALLKGGAKKIYAGARNLDNLTALVDKNPQVIEPVLLDVTNPQHVKALSEKITELDLLINNAGIANACNCTSDNAVEIARLEMETNYFSVMEITQAVLGKLKQSKQAAIINVSSIAGISYFPGIGPYSATKAAVHSFTQGLRAELKNDGVQVLGVYPGPVDTRMAEAWDIEKASPQQVAEKTFAALSAGESDVRPDDFSQQMYAAFLKHPHELEKVFADMM